MTDFKENNGEIGNSIKIEDGGVQDFERLPGELGIPQTSNDEIIDGMTINVEPTFFGHDDAKRDVEEGVSRLRLARDINGNIAGFTVVTPSEGSSFIPMIWVKPEMRRTGLGERLLKDAVELCPTGEVQMNIWGGESMINLGTKLGFTQRNGTLFVLDKADKKSI